MVSRKKAISILLVAFILLLALFLYFLMNGERLKRDNEKLYSLVVGVFFFCSLAICGVMGHIINAKREQEFRTSITPAPSPEDGKQKAMRDELWRTGHTAAEIDAILPKKVDTSQKFFFRISKTAMGIIHYGFLLAFIGLLGMFTLAIFGLLSVGLNSSHGFDEGILIVLSTLLFCLAISAWLAHGFLKERASLGWDILLTSGELSFIKKTQTLTHPLNTLAEINVSLIGRKRIFVEVRFKFKDGTEFMVKTMDFQFKDLNTFFETALTTLGVGYQTNADKMAFGLLAAPLRSVTYTIG